MKAKIKFQVAKQVGPQQMINISAINHVTRQLYDIYIIYIYFASQKYKVRIIRNLQYIYETLKFKIYFLYIFYSFVYMDG